MWLFEHFLLLNPLSPKVLQGIDCSDRKRVVVKFTNNIKEREHAVLTFLKRKNQEHQIERYIALPLTTNHTQTEIITPYAGKNLNEWLRSQKQQQNRSDLDENTIKPIFFRLCKALQCLHKQGLSHGALCLDHACIDSAGNVSLVSLGKAQSLSLNRSHWVTGSLQYISPEAYSCLAFRSPQKSKSSYSIASNDVFSLACCLLALLGIQYNMPDPLQDPLFKLMYEERDWMSALQLSSGVIDLLDKLLQPESKRINLNQLLAHPWLHTEQILDDMPPISLPPTSQTAKRLFGFGSLLNHGTQGFHEVNTNR